TAALTTALQTVSTILAKMRSVRASSPAANTSERVPEEAASPPIDPHPAAMHPPLLGAQEPGIRRSANGQILRHPAGSVIDHQARQAQDSAMPVRTEDLFQVLPRSPSSIPRLASE